MTEKYFKNQTTGNILVIKNIFLDSKQVVFNLFDNPMQYKQDIALELATFTLDISYLPEIPLKYEELIEWLLLKTVESLYPNFELVSEVKEWDYETGSTGAPITVRVFMPNYLISTNAYQQTPLGLLLTAMAQTLTNHATTGITGRVQYLEELLPEHRAILEMYEGIIIEDKPILEFI